MEILKMLIKTKSSVGGVSEPMRPPVVLAGGGHDDRDPTDSFSPNLQVRVTLTFAGVRGRVS